MTTEDKKIDQHDEQIMNHDYDGIKELDNPPPRWIMALFYITIAFAIIYGAYYFWLGVGDHQDAEYVKSSQKHEAKFKKDNVSSEELVALTDAASMEEGKTIYNEMNCFACHGMKGEGNAIGPNLTDKFSIHGCDFKSVFSIIKNGNPAKGMAAFKAQMSDEKIQKVASYVNTLIGTNPTNAKAAQGEKCE